MNISVQRKDRALCALDDAILNKEDMTMQTRDAAIDIVNILGHEDFPVQAVRRCLVDIVMGGE